MEVEKEVTTIRGGRNDTCERKEAITKCRNRSEGEAETGHHVVGSRLSE